MKKFYMPLAVILVVLLIAAAAYSLSVTSRSRVIGGVSVGEVVVDNTVPLRIRYAAGGISAADRADIIAQRLAGMENLRAQDFTVARVNGEWAVLARGELLATADSRHAAANNTTPYALAQAWRNQLQSSVTGQVSGTPPVGAGVTQEEIAAAAQPVNTAQKLVPIISVGSGIRVGAALVAGSSAQVEKVKAVAQIEGDFSGNVRVRALVPVETENVVSNIRRVPGTAVIGVGDIRL